MNPDQQQSIALQLIGALLISTISGAISLGRRILKYGRLPIIGLLTEMTASVLVGYLAWDAYPGVAKHIPDWVSQPIFVAACASLGSRLFQVVETLLEFKMRIFGSKENEPK